MKKCPGCDTTKQREDFALNRRKSDGLQTQCRDCQAKWYRNNKAVHVKRCMKNVKERRDKNYAYLREYLRSHPCVDCGETDLDVLEFDHVRGVKRQAVTVIAKQGWALTTLQTEIEKCDVRCANDHRRRHARERRLLDGSNPSIPT